MYMVNNGILNYSLSSVINEILLHKTMFTKGKHVFYTYILLKQTIWSIWVFFFNLHLGIFVANQSNKTAKKLNIIVFILKESPHCGGGYQSSCGL